MKPSTAACREIENALRFRVERCQPIVGRFRDVAIRNSEVSLAPVIENSEPNFTTESGHSPKPPECRQCADTVEKLGDSAAVAFLTD